MFLRLCLGNGQKSGESSPLKYTRPAVLFLVLSIILECTSRLFNLSYFNTILCLNFGRRFKGKFTKFIDQSENLDVLQSGFTFKFLPQTILLPKILLPSLLKKIVQRMKMVLLLGRWKQGIFTKMQIEFL